MAIKIYIDQGHNPRNPNAGAEGNGLREQDIVYPIGIELAARLVADSRFEARLSHDHHRHVQLRESASESSGRKRLGRGLFYKSAHQRIRVKCRKRKRGLCLFKSVRRLLARHRHTQKHDRRHGTAKQRYEGANKSLRSS